MPGHYRIEFEVDGRLRHGGQSYIFGAAAAVRMKPCGKFIAWTRDLATYSTPAPTIQRAEFIAIITALELAQGEAENLEGKPIVDVKIRTNSKYAIKAMVHLSHKWAQNGWLTAQGLPVANQDLIKMACRLDDGLNEIGSVEYIWEPLCQIQSAHEHCVERLDTMDSEISHG